MIRYQSSILLLGVAICIFSIYGRAEQQNTVEAQDSHVAEQVGESPDGFSLTTRFDKTTFKDGEPIKVAFSLRNLRPTTEYFVRQRRVRDFMIKVTTADGKSAPLTEYGRMVYDAPMMGSSTTIKMKQGDEISDSLLVNRIYDMSQGGKYNITVVTRMPAERIDVTSKSTTVTVDFEG